MISPAPAWSYVATAGFSSKNEPLHAQLFTAAALDRGLSVSQIGSDIYLAESDAVGSFCFTAKAPSTQGFVARQLASDKLATTRLLERRGFRTANGRQFTGRQLREALAYFSGMRGPAVVKPVSGSGGNGVTVNITTEEHFRAAWAFAGAIPRKRILVERYVTGNDHRIFVIGDRVIAAARRHPAAVTGDGTHSIAGLVQEKSERRRSIPYVGGKPIP